MTEIESLTHAERRERGREVFASFMPKVPGGSMPAAFEAGLGAVGTFVVDVAGEMWSRPELSRRDRSLVVISALAALQCTDELELHTRVGRLHGLTIAEIDEIVTTVAGYCGFPASIAARRHVDAGLKSFEGTDRLPTRSGATAKSDDDRDLDAYEVFSRMKGGEVSGGVDDHHARMVARHGGVGLVAYRYAFGEIWARDELSRRDRSLAVISILTAIGCVQELHAHVPAGLRHGLTPTEIDAALTHLSLYVGLPRAIDAARIAQPLIRDLAAIVRRYNEACSTGTVEQVMSFFTDDAVIYDLNHPPVVGREAIGRFWSRIREKWDGAVWDTDSVLVQGTTATAEWTMRGRADGEPFSFRGVDVFHASENGLLREIRQYWNFRPEAMTSELVGYPYPRT